MACPSGGPPGPVTAAISHPLLGPDPVSREGTCPSCPRGLAGSATTWAVESQQKACGATWKTGSFSVPFAWWGLRGDPPGGGPFHVAHEPAPCQTERPPGAPRLPQRCGFTLSVGPWASRDAEPVSRVPEGGGPAETLAEGFRRFPGSDGA